MILNSGSYVPEYTLFCECLTIYYLQKSTGSAPKHNFVLVDTCQYQNTTQRDCSRSVDGEAGDGAEILGSAIPGQEISFTYSLGME
jgi:hypothetical protein